MKLDNKAWKTVLIPSVFAFGVMTEKGTVSSRSKEDLYGPKKYDVAEKNEPVALSSGQVDFEGNLGRVRNFAMLLEQNNGKSQFDLSKVTTQGNIAEESARAKAIATFIIEGRENFEGRQWRDALLAFRQVLEISPQNLTAQRFVRRIFQELVVIKKESPDQFEAIRREISSNPVYKDLIAYEVKDAFQKGFDKYKEGKYEKSMAYFEETLILNPQHRYAKVFMRKNLKRQEIKTEQSEMHLAMLYAEEMARERSFTQSVFTEKSELFAQEEAQKRQEMKRELFASARDGSFVEHEAVLTQYADVIYAMTISNYKQAEEKLVPLMAKYPGIESFQQIAAIMKQKLQTGGALLEEEKALVLAYHSSGKAELIQVFRDAEEAQKLTHSLAQIKMRGYTEEELKAQVIAKKEEQLRIAEFSQKKARITDLMSQAKALYAQAKWDESIGKFQDVLALDPLHHESVVYIGLAKKHKERDELAKKRENLFFAEKKETGIPYLIDVDDVVRVTVLFHEEFSGAVTVGSDGSITLPLAGIEVKAAGLTEKQLSEEVARKLSRFVENPEIFVKVAEFNSKKIYVLGEISSPGIYRLKNRDLTIRELMFMAGLPSKASALRRVQIIRQTPEGPVRKLINVYDILYNGNLKNDIILKNGDIVYVPKRFTSKFSEVVSEIKAPFDTVGDLEASRADFYTLWNKFREKVLKDPGGF